MVHPARQFVLPLFFAAAFNVGCGADICGSDAGELEGEFDIEFTDDDGDKHTVTLVIDADGQVDVEVEDGDDWSCDVLQPELCDLIVECQEDGGDGEFRIELQRNED